MAGINGQNVGRDVTLVVQTPIGAFNLNVSTNFKSNQKTDQREHRPMNGPPVMIDIPAGWEGSLEADRSDSSWDDLIAAQELGYFNGAGIQPSDIFETIPNATDNTVSVYHYAGVAWHFQNAGDKKADDLIKQAMNWRSSTRIKLS
jgi:hypothetical protein